MGCSGKHFAKEANKTEIACHLCFTKLAKYDTCPLVLLQIYQLMKHKLQHIFLNSLSLQHQNITPGKHVLRGNPQRLQNEKHIN